MYLFPTKALSQDQLSELYALIQKLEVDIKTYTFDGDTPQSARRLIRSAGHIVISNPDMLHSGILPHHTRWIKLFENLKYVVIDEVHNYRGVFGSHLANVIKRLRRICEFHGSHPQFICCSATIANPAELTERIIGRPVQLINNNGAPSGEKHFLMYNPPVVNKQLGIRRSAVTEAATPRRLVSQAPYPDPLSLPTTASMSRSCRPTSSASSRGNSGAVSTSPAIAGGYLPNERRAYRTGPPLRLDHRRRLDQRPRTRYRCRQSRLLDHRRLPRHDGFPLAGRPDAPGRRSNTSVTILVANSSAINQFLCTEPKYVFERTPEAGIIDPDNLIIRTNHLKCAAFELPFTDAEIAGDDGAREILEYLEDSQMVHRSKDRYHWSSEIYPAQEVSLRSASPENFVILNESNNSEVIGEVDFFSAPIFLHPQAIYLHRARQFQVTDFDWEGRKAHVKEVEVDYYTDAETKTDLKVLDIDQEDSFGDAAICCGEVSVTCTTVLYKKIKFETHENVGWGKLTMPELEMPTHSFWYSYPGDIGLRLGVDGSAFGGALRGLANVMGKIAPLWVMCDTRDLRSISQVRAPFTERPTIYIYENIPGGVGLSEKLFSEHERLFEACYHHVKTCPCKSGCPTCVGPAMEVGDGGKDGALKLLEFMLATAVV